MADISGYLDIIRSSQPGESVRDAIIKCMNDINQDSAIKVVTAVKEGTIKDGETKNFPFKAPTGEAWSQFTLKVKSESSSSSDAPESVIMDDIKITNDTPNGKVEVESGHQIGSVTVEIDNLYRSSEIADNISIELDQLDEMMGFSATEQGYTAMKRITITGAAAAQAAAASGGEIGPGGVYYYPVNFYADTAMKKLITTVKVSKGGNALKSVNIKSSDIINDDPTKDWVGWSPDPSYVTRAMDCIPTFSTPPASAGDIEDDWEVIVQNPGAYAIGSTKTLRIVADIPEGSYTFYSSVKTNSTPHEGYDSLTNPHLVLRGEFKMMLVDKGNQTSWLALNPIKILSSTMYINWIAPQSYSGKTYFSDAGNVQYYWTSGVDDWSTSYARQFLNNILYGAIPSTIKKNIKSVKKYSFGFIDPYTQQNSPTNDDFVTITTSDKIWLPSISELFTLLSYGVENKAVAGGSGFAPTLDRLYSKLPGSIDFTENETVRNAIDTAYKSYNAQGTTDHTRSGIMTIRDFSYRWNGGSWLTMPLTVALADKTTSNYYLDGRNYSTSGGILTPNSSAAAFAIFGFCL